MAALSRGQEMPLYGGSDSCKLTGPALGADVFYAGALVYAQAASGKIAVTGSAGDRIVGIVTRTQTILAADEIVEYVVGGTYQFPTLGSVTPADLGGAIVMKASVLTDNPADCTSQKDAAAATNDIYVGRMVGWDQGSGKPIVRLDATGLLCTVTTGAWT